MFIYFPLVYFKNFSLGNTSSQTNLLPMRNMDRFEKQTSTTMPKVKFGMRRSKTLPTALKAFSKSLRKFEKAKEGSRRTGEGWETEEKQFEEKITRAYAQYLNAAERTNVSENRIGPIIKEMMHRTICYDNDSFLLDDFLPGQSRYTILLTKDRVPYSRASSEAEYQTNPEDRFHRSTTDNSLFKTWFSNELSQIDKEPSTIIKKRSQTASTNERPSKRRRFASSSTMKKTYSSDEEEAKELPIKPARRTAKKKIITSPTPSPSVAASNASRASSLLTSLSGFPSPATQFQSNRRTPSPFLQQEKITTPAKNSPAVLSPRGKIPNEEAQLQKAASPLTASPLPVRSPVASDTVPDFQHQPIQEPVRKRTAGKKPMLSRTPVFSIPPKEASPTPTSSESSSSASASPPTGSVNLPFVPGRGKSVYLYSSYQPLHTELEQSSDEENALSTIDPGLENLLSENEPSVANIFNYFMPQHESHNANPISATRATKALHRFTRALELGEVSQTNVSRYFVGSGPPSPA